MFNKQKFVRPWAKFKVWWPQHYPDLALPSGWALITLAAFQFSLRAWEASIGIYLLFYVVLRFVEAWIASKAAATARHARGN